MVCVQKLGFSPSVFHPARAEQCSLSGLFRSRLPRNREQILFWKILTFFPISIYRVFYFVTTPFTTGALTLHSKTEIYRIVTFADADRRKVYPYSTTNRAQFSNGYRGCTPPFVTKSNKSSQRFGWFCNYMYLCWGKREDANWTDHYLVEHKQTESSYKPRMFKRVEECRNSCDPSVTNHRPPTHTLQERANLGK